jgi:hypothetical protein
MAFFSFFITGLRWLVSLLVGLALSLAHPFSDRRPPALPGKLGRAGWVTLASSRDDSEASRASAAAHILGSPLIQAVPAGDFARVWLADAGDLFMACQGTSELIALQRRVRAKRRWLICH